MEDHSDQGPDSLLSPVLTRNSVVPHDSAKVLTSRSQAEAVVREPQSVSVVTPLDLVEPAALVVDVYDGGGDLVIKDE